MRPYGDGAPNNDSKTELGSGASTIQCETPNEARPEKFGHETAHFDRRGGPFESRSPYDDENPRPHGPSGRPNGPPGPSPLGIPSGSPMGSPMGPPRGSTGGPPMGPPGGGPPGGMKRGGPPGGPGGPPGGPGGPPFGRPGGGPGGPPMTGQLEGKSKGQIALIMFALCMAVFLAALDVTIITTALPRISEHFRSPTGYVWIGSGFLLGNSASTPIWGKISDIFGRKIILLVANMVFLVGSLLAAVSINIEMMIAARVIQGVGAGGLVTLVNICIGDMFSMRNRGAYYGIIGGVWAVASSLGPILGGVFTEYAGWRWCFYINLPLDGAAFLIILFFLDIKTNRSPFWEGMKAIDWTGALLIMGGTIMFLFGIEFGGVRYPWASPMIIGLIAGGIVTWGLFFVNEAKWAKYPITPLRIFKYRSNVAALGVCFIHGFVFIAASYYLPLYFQAVRGASPLMSGVYLLPTALALSILSATTGLFIKKTGQYLPAIWFGMFFMTLGYGLLTDLRANTGWAKIIAFQIIAGIGVGPNFQSPLIALQSKIEPRDIGTGTAVFGFVRNLATAISVVIGGVVFQNEMSKRNDALVESVGPERARALGGGNAGAAVGLVATLNPEQQVVVRTQYSDSIRALWIMYTAFSGFGLLVAFLITRQTLTRHHEPSKLGLDQQKLDREQDIERKRESKRTSGMSNISGSHSKQAEADKERDMKRDSGHPGLDMNRDAAPAFTPRHSDGLLHPPNAIPVQAPQEALMSMPSPDFEKKKRVGSWQQEWDRKKVAKQYEEERKRLSRQIEIEMRRRSWQMEMEMKLEMERRKQTLQFEMEKKREAMEAELDRVRESLQIEPSGNKKSRLSRRGWSMSSQVSASGANHPGTEGDASRLVIAEPSPMPYTDASPSYPPPPTDAIYPADKKYPADNSYPADKKYPVEAQYPTDKKYPVDAKYSPAEISPYGPPTFPPTDLRSPRSLTEGDRLRASSESRHPRASSEFRQGRDSSDGRQVRASSEARQPRTSGEYRPIHPLNDDSNTLVRTDSQSRRFSFDGANPRGSSEFQYRRPSMEQAIPLMPMENRSRGPSMDGSNPRTSFDMRNPYGSAEPPYYHNNSSEVRRGKRRASEAGAPENGPPY